MAVKYGIRFFLFIIILLPFGVLADNTKDEDISLNQENIHIEIHHCTSCGFRARAVDLAEELNKEFGVEAKLVAGERGSFDVYVNDKLIFSKFEAGRFPDPLEIIEKIKEYVHTLK